MTQSCSLYSLSALSALCPILHQSSALQDCHLVWGCLPPAELKVIVTEAVNTTIRGVGGGVQVPGHNFDGLLGFSSNIEEILKKCHQRQYLLRKLRSFGVDKDILLTFTIPSLRVCSPSHSPASFIPSAWKIRRGYSSSPKSALKSLDTLCLPFVIKKQFTLLTGSHITPCTFDTLRLSGSHQAARCALQAAGHKGGGPPLSPQQCSSWTPTPPCSSIVVMLSPSTDCKFNCTQHSDAKELSTQPVTVNTLYHLHIILCCVWCPVCSSMLLLSVPFSWPWEQIKCFELNWIVAEIVQLNYHWSQIFFLHGAKRSVDFNWPLFGLQIQIIWESGLKEFNWLLSLCTSPPIRWSLYFFCGCPLLVIKFSLRFQGLQSCLTGKRHGL